jgi:hypothetical protein
MAKGTTPTARGEQPVTLKDIERKAWRSTYQDGLLDIFLGLLLLAMAVGAWLSDSGFVWGLQMGVFVGLEIGALLAFFLGKKFITVPRLGLVRFGPKGKTRKKRAVWLGAASALVGLAVFGLALVGLAVFGLALVANGNLREQLLWEVIIPAAYVLNMLVVFSLGAYFLDVARLYVVGLMVALALPLDMLMREVFDADLTFLAFGIPAMVVLVMGTVVLVRFLRAYPMPEEGAGHDDG